VREGQEAVAMAIRSLMFTLVLALACAASASAQIQQQQPRIPNLRAPPTEVPVGNFAAGQARCDTTARTARVALNVTLRPLDTQIRGTTASVDILVDGVAQGVRTATIRRDAVATGVGAASILVSRDLSVPFPSGTKRVQVVLNGNYRTAEQSFTYSCYTARLQTPQVTQTVQLPDVAVGPMIIFWYDPPLPDFDPCHGHGRNPFGDCNIRLPQQWWYELPPNAVTWTDFNAVVPFWRVTGSTCPRTGEASVTVTVAVSFVANSLMPRAEDYALPQGVVEEGFFGFAYQSEQRTFSRGVAYLDARHTTRQVRPGNQPYPVGYEWIYFHRTVPCTNDGAFEFRFDPSNTVREQDENNNLLRFRYRTRPM
jgi:hypothetical protein